MDQQILRLLNALRSDVAELRQDNQQLRQDLLKHTATGWQEPLTVGRALGFTGSDESIVKKMHRLREDGTFGRPKVHYRNISKGARPTYQYHIGNCDKAVTRSRR